MRRSELFVVHPVGHGVGSEDGVGGEEGLGGGFAVPGRVLPAPVAVPGADERLVEGDPQLHLRGER